MFSNKKIFWFDTDKNDVPFIIRPDKTTRRIHKTTDAFSTPQGIAGWQRTVLYMEEMGIWDITAFICGIDSAIVSDVITLERNYEPYECFLAFFSAQSAETQIYPHISKEKIQASTGYVEAFYKNVNLQFSCEEILLHPVCFMISSDGTQMDPLSISEAYHLVYSANSQYSFYRYSKDGTGKEHIKFDCHHSDE